MDVRRGVAAALCVPLLALAACSDGDSEASPTDPSSTAAPTPSKSDPSVPPEATSMSAEGAEAFLRYFISTINLAERTGDVAPLRQASSPRCKSCMGIVNTVEDLYASGGHIESGGWTVSGLSTYPDGSPERPVIAARVRIASQRAFAADGKVHKFKGGMQSADFRLSWLNEEWIVTRFDLVAS